MYNVPGKDDSEIGRAYDLSEFNKKEILIGNLEHADIQVFSRERYSYNIRLRKNHTTRGTWKTWNGITIFS